MDLTMTFTADTSKKLTAFLQNAGQVREIPPSEYWRAAVFAQQRSMCTRVCTHSTGVLCLFMGLDS